MLERSDAVTWLSLRNAQEVHIVAVDQLNTYDVLSADDVVFTKGAYDAFVDGTAVPERKADGAKPAAEDAVEEKPAAKKPAAKKATAEKAADSRPKKAAAKKAPAKKAAAEEGSRPRRLLRRRRGQEGARQEGRREARRRGG